MLGWLAFDPPLTESEHIVDKEGIGKVIQTNENLLIGKMSFQMKVDEFDINWFELVKSTDNMPLTGTKISLDGIKNYQKQSTFRFTAQLASKNADLANIVLSRGEVNELEPEESTYKEYELTPEFEKDTLKYEVTLMEYIDTMDIKALLADEKSTMKIKVPKRDEDGNLMYESDGGAVVTDEKELLNNNPLEFVLNKLGEPDTILIITVTAEDGKTTKQYELVIKRPYGVIKGQIHTVNTNDVHIADLKIYDNSEAIDWEGLVGHDDLDLIETKVTGKSNEDGTYEIKVIPGIYDFLIDKPAYLDYTVTNIVIDENEEIDLGYEDLVPGDVNKDGIIEGEDLTFINIYYDVMEGEPDYSLNYDINEDEIIEGEDLTYINIYYDTMKKIIEYIK